MAKKKIGQFDHYKKWKTDQGYTFLAENKKDAKKYLKITGDHLGKLEEVLMSNIAQPNYSEALKEIKEAIRILTNEVSEIKTLLFRIHDVKEKAEIEEKMYPWNFPNVTTTADVHKEE